jgi:hypothetical protein
LITTHRGSDARSLVYQNLKYTLGASVSLCVVFIWKLIE